MMKNEPSRQLVREHALKWAKGGSALLGPVGSAIATIILEYLPNRRLDRLERFAARVESVLAGKTLLETDDVAFLVERACRVAASDHRDFKHAMLASILQGVAYSERIDVSIERQFIDLVDRVEPLHVALLRRLRSPRAEDEDGEWINFSSLKELVVVDGYDTSSVADNLVVEALSFLTSQGVVATRQSANSAGSIMLGVNIVGLWRKCVYRLTPLGARFVAHLEAESHCTRD